MKKLFKKLLPLIAEQKFHYKNITKIEVLQPMNKDFFTLDITGELGDLANYKLPDPTLIDYYKRLKNE